jgi:preprotein translocase subunit SecF
VSPAERFNPRLGRAGNGGRPAPEGPANEEGLAVEGPEAAEESAESEDLEPVDEAATDDGEADEEEADEEEAAAAVPESTAGPGPKRPSAFMRLYRGQTSFDFVGRRRIWFTISAIIIIAGLASLGIRGLNLGIDFKGGTSWTIQAPGVTQAQATTAVENAGLSQPVVEVLGRGDHQSIEVQADLLSLPQSEQTAIKAKVTAAMEHLGQGQVNLTDVGPTWGGEVTQRALIALIAFFVAVVIYISFRFEPKMAVAAFIAMVHDLLVTIGVYSLAGFQVTPDTVIAILTILGYSLYDTVVVFDRVRDNAKGIGASGRMTYSDMVNLSMNQTLARSVNTSLVAILPVLAVLVVGAQFLGATTLQDFGLALFVGLLSGAYSSIFIASPVLAMMKEREPRWATIRKRLETRGDSLGTLSPTSAARLVATGAAGAAVAANRTATGTLRPGVAGKASGKSGTRTLTRPAAAPSNGANGGAAPGGTTTASGSRRPPPRPRKGGTKGSKSKRRR